MVRFFNSGLYTDPFYKLNNDIFEKIGHCPEDISFNRELYAKYCMDLEDDIDEDTIDEEIYNLFIESLAYWTIYYEPLVFDEEIAYECGLVPFSFENINLLALGGCGMDLSPKLDAYQVLTHGSIDKYSRFFKHEDYFKYVVSDTVYRKVNKLLKESQQ